MPEVEQLEAWVREQAHLVKQLKDKIKEQATELGAVQVRVIELSQQNWLYMRERDQLKHRLKEATDENVNITDELRHIQRRVLDDRDHT